MARNQNIELHCFGAEIGRIGFDEDRNTSFFQYNPAFLASGKYMNLFPFVLKRTGQMQVFSKFTSETFKGLPPMIADSLPEVFGNIIFKAWMEASDKDFEKISVLEQLAYVGHRGIGAMEYQPSEKLAKNSTIDLDEITQVVTRILEQKNQTSGDSLDTRSLLNIFRIGSSAGGGRPKILISRHKQTGRIIPGDMQCSGQYDHYLVKLHIPEEQYDYSREVVEYCYYLTATELGIEMMPSHLIDGKHFATLRFDRQHGGKQHVLTATGMTGWDFKDPEVSSYENLFDLATALKLPPVQIDQLFKRMVFNIVFFNVDDHLKNHSFIYDPGADRWSLSPAYDLTYSLNPLLGVTRVSRALSVNGKRQAISLDDVMSIAGRYSIKRAQAHRTITSTIEAISRWRGHAERLKLPDQVISGIVKDFTPLIKV